ncbi:outer membrane protein assembly factor BamD [Reinekea sp.]|jgi:outer membrane protein assembly factor BamD|uniref:outer membrane protein assembly factor BamD n=1 Tax=Reinekea sp. TaxID=1970455 RepID=UPI003989FF22
MYRAVFSQSFLQKVCLLGLIVSLAGCAGWSKQTSDTEAAYYDAAQTYLEKRNYSMAIEKLDALQSRFPFGRYSQASSIDLMYAKYQSKRFADSLITADRFTRLNADSPNIDYAWFIQAMSYYQMYMENSGIFGKADPAMRSPEQGEKAFSTMQSYLQMFPESEYRPEVVKAMVILKDSLAKHELYVADFYLRKQAWVSAADRAAAIINHYPGVAAQADAYLILIASYDALGLEEEKNIAIARLTMDFPTHDTLTSGDYIAPKHQRERWWVKALTLGIAQ